MTIRRLTWQSFRIPFRAPFSTARGAMACREGIIVRLETDDGLVGLGEASPLAAWGGGTVADVDRLLRERAPRWLRRLSQEGKDAEGDRGAGGCASAPRSLITGSEPREAVPGSAGVPPAPWSHEGEESVALRRDGAGGTPALPGKSRPDVLEGGAAALLCALDTARLDILARRQGVRVADILAGASPNNAASAVAVSAVIGSDDPLAAAEAAALAARRGFRCVKLKVGMLGSPRAEAARVAGVRAALGPGVVLRLDANGAWDPKRAVETIRACEPHGIELIEQPVPAEALDDLARVTRAVDTPVAADECASDPERARRVVELRAADLIVLKPMALGGCTRALQLAGEARRAGLGVLVTTTLDAGVGVAAALHLAAALQPLPASGLATAALLESDLLHEGIPVSEGLMGVPAGPGLGIALDEDALWHYAGPHRGEVWLDGDER